MVTMKQVIDKIFSTIENDKTISLTILGENNGFALTSISNVNDIRITDHCSLCLGNVIINFYDIDIIEYDQEEDTYIMKKGNSEIQLGFF